MSNQQYELEGETRGTKYGYARVSTKYQSLDAQIEALHRAGIPYANIISESVSSRKRRPALDALLEELEEGDELHVAKLDRLGRSNREIHETVEKLDKRGVIFVFNGQAYNPRDPFGKMFFALTAVFAELERDLIASRTKETLAAIKASGGQVGRAPSTTPAVNAIIVEMIDKGFGVAEVVKVAGVSRSTVYRVLDSARANAEAEADPSIRRRRREMDAADEKARAKSLAKFEKRVAAARAS